MLLSNSRKRHCAVSEGFTYIEVIIIFAIIALVSGIAVSRLVESPSDAANTTDADAEDIVNLLSIGQSNAAANKLNDHWGIKVGDNLSTPCGASIATDCVILYKGNDFNARDETYDRVFRLRGENIFTNVIDTDFYFNKVSGFAQGLSSTVTTTIEVTNTRDISTTTIYSNGHADIISS